MPKDEKPKKASAALDLGDEETTTNPAPAKAGKGKAVKTEAEQIEAENDELDELDADEESEDEDSEDETNDSNTLVNTGLPKAPRNAQAGAVNGPTKKPRAMIERVKMPERPASPDGRPTSPDAGLSADQRKIKGVLENQDKYPIFVPFGLGERQGAVKDVIVQGFHMQIPKGVMVNVPKTVYEVLISGMELKGNAGISMLADRPDDQGNFGSVADAL